MAKISIAKARIPNLKEILQINGTVIAGALILLTISSTTKIVQIQALCNIANITLVGLSVLMFTLSSLTAIASPFFSKEEAESGLRMTSMFFMAIGFFILLLAMVLLVVNSPNCNNPALGQEIH